MLGALWLIRDGCDMPGMERREGLKRLALLAGLGGAGPALAQAVATRPVRDEAALTAIVERLTGGKVQFFGAGPLPGLHEVIVKDKVFYIDAAGEHLIDGHIIDIANRRSLTAQRQAEYVLASTPTLRLSELDLADAIIIQRGKVVPGRVLVSFEDPRCGFCKRLHVTLKDATDLTVHTFPISYLGPESRALNERIWCAPSRPIAWEAAMADQEVPGNGATGCGFEALERNMALAEKFRVQGTPTLFTAEGQRLNGAVKLDVIEGALKGA
jgi:thiol:disulfide interchange protein DsbC